MEVQPELQSPAELREVEGKTAYEILRDAHVAELAERFKFVQAASTDL
jgi:hypothetical protein